VGIGLRFEADELGAGSIEAAWIASLEPLKTRHEVRSFLARTLMDLVGALPPKDSPGELSGLATGSDREVIESYRWLEKFCNSLRARDPKYGGILVSLNVRDLFAQGLLRMKELPPDPRETLHAKHGPRAKVQTVT
jgi:hypothetical protein